MTTRTRIKFQKILPPLSRHYDRRDITHRVVQIQHSGCAIFGQGHHSNLREILVGHDSKDVREGEPMNRQGVKGTRIIMFMSNVLDHPSLHSFAQVPMTNAPALLRKLLPVGPKTYFSKGLINERHPGRIQRSRTSAVSSFSASVSPT